MVCTKIYPSITWSGVRSSIHMSDERVAPCVCGREGALVSLHGLNLLVTNDACLFLGVLSVSSFITCPFFLTYFITGLSLYFWL